MVGTVAQDPSNVDTIVVVFEHFGALEANRGQGGRATVGFCLACFTQSIGREQLYMGGSEEGRTKPGEPTWTFLSRGQ